MSEIVDELVLVKARDHSGNVYRFKEVKRGVSTAQRRLSRVELNCRDWKEVVHSRRDPQSELPRSHGMSREPQNSQETAIGLSQDLTCRSYVWWSKEPKTQNINITPENKYSDTARKYLKDARFLSQRPVLLVPLPSRVG